jgi:hypothetical protein
VRIFDLALVVLLLGWLWVLVEIAIRGGRIILRRTFLPPGYMERALEREREAEARGQAGDAA